MGVKQILPLRCLRAFKFHPVGEEGCGMKDLADYLVTPSAGKWKLILEYGDALMRRMVRQSTQW